MTLRHTQKEGRNDASRSSQAEYFHRFLGIGATEQQALVLGYAAPMPVVIHTREYGSPESYRELGFREASVLKAQIERDTEDLFGPSER